MDAWAGRVPVPRRAQRAPADALMGQVARLFVDERWSAVVAGTELPIQVLDEALLRRARAKWARASARRSSRVAERAVATLDIALTLHPRDVRGRSAHPSECGRFVDPHPNGADIIAIGRVRYVRRDAPGGDLGAGP